VADHLLTVRQACRHAPGTRTQPKALRSQSCSTDTTARSIIFRASAIIKSAGLAIAIIGALAASNQVIASATQIADGPRLIEAQYRSYLEGRDFQSYRQERGFVGERRFETLPDRGATRSEAPSADPDRPSRLQRRFYGASDSRCAGWSRRCDQRWGSGNRDYYGCMRYHACR